jgi:hypothetical protein
VQQEKSVGITLPLQQQHRANDEVESLYQSLMQGEPGVAANRRPPSPSHFN